MSWLRNKVLRWLYPNEVAQEVRGLSHDNPLIFNLGQGSDRHYIVVPVEQGFALVTRSAEDYHSPVKSSGPRAVVTFCPTAEDLSNTIIAKMAQHKLTAR